MDYEKKYKEALGMAEEIIRYYKEHNRGDETSIEDLEQIFPELKESEDERIRKALIKGVESCKASGWTNFGNNVDIDVVLAWLEKQGNEPNWCHHKVDLSDCSEEYRTGYYDGWNNCNMQHSQCKSELDDVVKCLINGMKFYYEDNEEATWGTEKFSMKVKDILVWLEKQGEQKPINDTDEEIVNAVKDTSVLDKVEPKFKVGDWIACEELNTAKIISLDGDKYEVEFIDGNKGFPHIDYIDRNFHLWTIQDAKDGDVLVDEDINVIGIFEGIEGMCWHSKFYYSDTTKEFYGIEYGGSHQKEFVKPATKEQRDLLFQKMKEFGYDWDADKKELKKIEKKPTEDNAAKASEKYRNYRMSCGITDPIMLDEIEEAYYEGAISRKSAEWSEEDKRMCQETIDWFEKKCFPYALEEENPARESIKWLKSLKDRVEPQPKQEWSEEDEKMYRMCIDAVEYYHTPEDESAIRDWLKSLKDRVWHNSWKPSEEQLDELLNV